MKPRGFALNPYAASYIPLSQREAEDRRCVNENFSMNNTGAQFSGTSEHYIHNQPHSIHMQHPSLDFNAHYGEKMPVAVASTLNTPSFHGSFPQHVGEATDMGMYDKEFDMDLEWLRTAFPGISEQSLADVYFANRGDLEAAIEMLSQLESYTVDSESLPDTLDIGDTSESGFPADQLSLKMKNVANDASTSSNF